MEMTMDSAGGDAFWVTPDLGIADAEWLMLGHRVDRAAVRAYGRRVGTLRAEDIARRATGAARGLRVADVMRRTAERGPDDRATGGAQSSPAAPRVARVPLAVGARAPTKQRAAACAPADNAPVHATYGIAA